MKVVKLLASVAVVGMAMLGSAAPAWAWPDKSLSVIVPFPAGGATDN